MSRSKEAQRILAEYGRRDRDGCGRYSPFVAGALFARQQRARAVLRALDRAGLSDLSERRVLDVGCGRGDWLADFEEWGASRRLLAAIDLDPARAAHAQARFPAHRDDAGVCLAPGADIRTGDASSLPWDDASFDIVVQSTVFSSILDASMQRAVAAEMARVLRPGGVVLWYDFFWNNPKNAAVRGVSAPEVRELFPALQVSLRRVTLGPPIARRVAPVSWTLATLLEGVRLLNTHYLGVLRRSG